MAKFWDIAVKNLKTTFRNKTSFLFILLVPVLFYAMMGFLFGGAATDGNGYIYQVGWVDLDTSDSNNDEHPNYNVTFIRDIVANISSIDIHVYDTNESAKLDLEDKVLDAYIVFPQGFELYINGTGPEPEIPTKIFFRDSTEEVTRSIISAMLQSIIDGVINYDPGAITLVFENDTVSGVNVNDITIGTPGYIMYGILASLSGAVILLTSEHKEGLLKRLESSQMTAVDMLGGHLVSNTIFVFLQFFIGIGVLSIFGFSPVYANLPTLIIGSFLTVLLASLFVNSLALVSGVIFKTPDAAGGGVWIILIPLMMFSGAFFPLELVAPSLIPYVSWLPTRIIVVVFQDLLVNGISLASGTIWANLGIVAIFGGVLFALGVKLYGNYAKN